MATLKTLRSQHLPSDSPVDTHTSLDTVSVVDLEHEEIHWALKVKPDEEIALKTEFNNFRTKWINHEESREEENAQPDKQNITNALFLATAFLQYLVSEDRRPLIQVVLCEIQRQFIRDTGLHFLVSELDTKAQASILKSYYAGVHITGGSAQSEPSALFDNEPNPSTKIYAIFGGQGPSNGHCLQELQDVCNIYYPLLKDLLDIADATLSHLRPRSRAIDFEGTYDLNLKMWLEQPDTAPPTSIIATAPFSFPLIGLLGLSHYCVTCKVLGKTPEQLRSSLQGVTGHSQGVLVAAVIAASTSWDSFYDWTRFALEALFWIGFESHREMTFPQLSLLAIQSCIDQGEGAPSPMLSVRGLDRNSITKLIENVNHDLKTDEQVYLALVNARNNMVVAGPPRSLYGVNSRLRIEKAQADSNQKRGMFNRRIPAVQHEFLPISAAFHCPYSDRGVFRILEALQSFSLAGKDLGIPLFHTKTGKDLRRYGEQDVIKPLVRMITSEMVDWPCASKFPEVSHLIDFGPGRIGSLGQKAMEGTGVQVILAHELRSPSEDIAPKALLFSALLPALPDDWAQVYMPQVDEDASGVARLKTRMTRMMGVPPIMVAGMTPTTVPWDFVASIMQAGYHAELAGGGYLHPQHFEDAIRKLSAKIPNHRGITCNIIYASPKAVAWQIPLIRRMVQEGYPIDGLTIGAGVPSTEVVADYVNTLGLKYISFKPGSQESILQVLKIAHAHPHTSIGLQWTGGRGGGHHSSEDFHAPILEMYGKIRKCGNIILIAGSGFGGAEDTLPYMTGEWSLLLGYPRMPFDGVLLGSRMMVAKEAHTAREAKDLIVQAKGVDDSEWHTSYEKETGGVITVTSEMGQPIHKLATRGVLLWKDLDQRIFSISDRHKRVVELQKEKAELINRLNQDFQKPWFGLDSEGLPAEIEDMTYYDVLQRLVSLMYVKDQRRWIDPSYRNFVLAFGARAQERLRSGHGTGQLNMNDPDVYLKSFLQAYPNAFEELLHPEDVSYFISLCLQKGQKPINFIPRLDENFETWFKKDSLWQAEDIDAVIDRDVQRVCIIHGPVAARYSHIADEPSKSILDNILTSWTESIRLSSARPIHANPQNDSQPSMGSLDGFPDLVVEETYSTKSYVVEKELADGELLLEHLGNELGGWAQACIMDQMIIRGQQRHVNPIRNAIMPTSGHTISIHYGDNRQIDALAISKNSSSTQQQQTVLHISSQRGNIVKVVLTELTHLNRNAKLELVFEYHPDRTINRLTEITEDRTSVIKAFYSELWLGGYSKSLRDSTVHSRFVGPSTTISREMVQDFMRAIHQTSLSQNHQPAPTESLPIDICIMLAWEVLVQPLLISAIDSDLLQLLHRSNEFRYVEGATPLRVGDVVDCSSHIQAITNSSTGKTIEVIATVRRGEQEVVIVTSVFFIRGTFNDNTDTFRRVKEPGVRLDIKDEKDCALLMSREWVSLNCEKDDLIGRQLTFNLNTQTTFENTGIFSSLQVTGNILTEINRKLHKIGTVFYETGQCHGNPVTTFLERHGSPVRAIRLLQREGWDGESSWTVKVPSNSAMYARVSKDSNPIHVSSTFAKFAQLQGIVTHGMLTSAVVRRLVEDAAAEADFTRFRRYSASFEGMVSPGDELKVELQHVGMAEGRLVLKIQAHLKETSTLVLEAEAEIEQQTSAYIFTGQGSQERGMGMALYNRSPVAKALWDRADKHLLDLYGKYIRVALLAATYV